MRIFLVRNAESKKIEKNGNIPDHFRELTDVGVEQARQCSKFLNTFLSKNKKTPEFSFTGNNQVNQVVTSLLTSISKTSKVPDLQSKIDDIFKVKLYHSPYSSSKETASIIKSNCSDFIKSSSEEMLLSDIQYGNFDLLTKSQQSEMKSYPSFLEERNIRGKFWTRYPGGESLFDLSVRVRTFIESLRNDQNNDHIQDVIVVCHSSVQKVLVNLLTGSKYEGIDKSPANCSIKLIDNSTDVGFIYKGFNGEVFIK